MPQTSVGLLRMCVCYMVLAAHLGALFSSPGFASSPLRTPAQKFASSPLLQIPSCSFSLHGCRSV